MSPTGFVARVALESAVAVGVLAAGAAWLAGASAAIGVLAGGALAVANLWWLGRRAAALTSGALARWSLGAILRLAMLGLAFAIVLTTGVAHPVAVVVGLTVLPFAIIVRGLATAGRLMGAENVEA